MVVLKELLRQRVHLEKEMRAISKTAKLAAKVGGSNLYRRDFFLMVLVRSFLTRSDEVAS